MIKNKQRFIKTLEQRLVDRPLTNIEVALFKSGAAVRNTAINSIAREPKTGRTYVRGNITHTASAAGEAPATDTGRLVNSIYHDTKKEGTRQIGFVAASVDYAIHLEFGTTNMAARPFLQPALRQNAKKITNIFKRQGLIK